MKVIDGFKFGVGFTIGLIVTSTIFGGTIFIIAKLLFTQRI